jgi:hypothetical protein
MEQRGHGTGSLFSWITALGALLLTGCASLAGAGVAAGLVVLGVVTHECYEYVDIKVIDGSTGNKICDAEVTAERDGDVDTLGSCYHASLTEGRWNLTATLPGRPPAKTSLVVAESESCEPVVATVVLTIPPAPGSHPTAAPPAPAAPPPPAPPPAAPEAPETPARDPSAPPDADSNPAGNPSSGETPETPDGVPTKSF